MLIYNFTLDNFLSVFDETPAEINIQGKTYSAVVFQVSQGLNVEIGIDNLCGQFIL